MAKISIHRALAELKLCDAKLNKTAQEIKTVLIYRKDGTGEAVRDEFKSKAQSDFDSLMAVIKNRQKIKTAIVKSNAETFVTVGNESMTVADAITLKSTIEAKKALIENFTTQVKKIEAELERQNTYVNSNMQTLLAAAVGKDNIKSTGEDVESIRSAYMKTNEFHLFDPIKIKEKTEKLTTEYLDFCTNVDAALSEINATTFIDIELS